MRLAPIHLRCTIVLTLGLGLYPVATSSPRAEPAFVEACHRLATLPDYTGNPVSGVPLERLNVDVAVPACERAVREVPSNGRLKFQLGRAYLKADKLAEALRQFQGSVAQDYGPAYLGMGDVHFAGIDGEPDFEQAAAFYRRAHDFGVALATFKLAQMHYDGLGVAEDLPRAFNLSNQAATQGVPQAQFAMAQLYHRGHGVEQDFEATAAWAQRAAETGLVSATRFLGQLYFDGIGVEQDKDRGVAMLRKAASNGDTEAQANLGMIYLGETGYPANYEEALQWNQRASQNGVASATGNLGYLHHHGKGVGQDRRRAAALYRSALDQGDHEAHRFLGLLYSDPSWPESNSETAEKHFSLAVGKGDSSAAFLLASMYEDGEFFPKDLTKAVEWYGMGAELGHEFSQYKFGISHLEGVGLKKDIEAGVAWIAKAARAGFDLANEKLGHLYLSGDLVKQSIPKAIKHYEAAGSTIAYQQLGNIYRQSQYSIEDSEKAFSYYLRAADRGDRFSKAMLGSMYQTGDGVGADSAMARRWYSEAAQEGDPYAQGQLGAMYATGEGGEKSIDVGARWFAAAAEQDHLYSLEWLAHLHESGLGVEQSYALSESYLLRAEKIAQKGGSDSGETTARLLDRLVRIQFDTGRYLQAEDTLKRLLLIWQTAKGNDENEAVGQALIFLASVYANQGRHEEVKKVFSRIERTFQQDRSQSRFLLGSARAIVARSLFRQGYLEEAESTYSVAFGELSESAENFPSGWAGLLLEHADVLMELKDFTRAESNIAEAQSTFHSVYGEDHPFNVGAIAKSAQLMLRQGNLESAERNFKKAWQLVQEIGIEDHPLVALGMAELAEVYRVRGQEEKALETIRTATRNFGERLEKTRGIPSRGVVFERRFLKNVFHQHLRVAHEAHDAGLLSREDLFNETLSVGQLATSAEVAVAINQLSARYSAPSKALAELVRQRQDAQERLLALDDKLTGNAPSAIGPDEREKPEDMRKERALLADRIAKADDRLATEFPDYVGLLTNRTHSLNDVQRALVPGEVLIKWAFGPDMSFAWVISKERAEIARLSVTRDRIEDMVFEIRRHLAALNTIEDIRASTFPVDTAHDLHKALFGDVEQMLLDTEHLITVPSGPLVSLPLGLIVTDREHTRPPSGSKPANHAVSLTPKGNDEQQRIRGIAPETVPRDAGPPQFRSAGLEVEWFAERYAYSVASSIGSFVALRRLDPPQGNRLPLLGFGDPVLGSRTSVRHGQGIASLYDRRGAVQIDAVMQLPELPDTSEELSDLADFLGAHQDSIFLRDRATEAHLRSLDLSEYKTVVFATHGLIAGELTGLSEPALILTPKNSSQTSEDGVLTASEIAELNLNADLVILSACNTAAPSGQPGADGLSGLARAFFLAGSRSILVSHWSVISEAAKTLTTSMLHHKQASDGVTKAQALQLAIIDILDAPGAGYMKHPIYWAPFVIVGEGR